MATIAYTEVLIDFAITLPKVLDAYSTFDIGEVGDPGDDIVASLEETLNNDDVLQHNGVSIKQSSSYGMPVSCNYQISFPVENNYTPDDCDYDTVMDRVQEIANKFDADAAEILLTEGGIYQ